MSVLDPWGWVNIQCPGCGAIDYMPVRVEPGDLPGFQQYVLSEVGRRLAHVTACVQKKETGR